LTPDATPAIGMKVLARIIPQAPFERPGAGYLTTFHAVTDNDGKLALRGLPDTKFVLSIEDPKKLWTFRPLEELAVRSAHELSLTLRMETGVLVSGRVLDKEGHPVAGAAFSAIAAGNVRPGLSEDVTDASGRYQFRLPAGGAQLYFNALPHGFVYPNPQTVKHLEIKAGHSDIGDLNFTLARESDKSH
jgi:hypothetical protein